MPKMKIVESNESFEETQGPLLTPGEVYEATITGFNAFEGKFGATVAWQLEVDDPEEDEPVEAVIFTSKSTNLDGDLAGDKTSNLLKYSGIFNGGELPFDEDGDFDYELLKGKRARIIAANYPSKNDPSIIKNKASGVLPLSTRKKSKAAA